MECIRVQNIALPRVAHLCLLRGDTCRTLHDTIDLVSCLDPLTDSVLIGLDREPIFSTSSVLVKLLLLAIGRNLLLIQKVLDLAELGRTVITLLRLFRLLLLLVVVLQILVLLHILILERLVILLSILQLISRGHRTRPRSHQNIPRV